MKLGLTIKQTQALSPQMMQAMEVLQMGTLELVEYIAEIVQENPVLESEDWYSARDDISQLRRKLEWLESTDVQNHWYHQQDVEASRTPLDRSSSTPLEESLYYHLKSQVHFDLLPPDLARVTDYLMESLTSNGWLDESVDDIAVHLNIEPAVVEQAVELVQSLDPAGVGARGLNECLRLQLERQGEDGLALTIVEHYLEAMSRDRYNLIAKETGASRVEVSEACALIRSLNPRPGMGFSPRENLHYVIPDLVVVNVEDRFEILTNDYFLSSLHVNGYYSQLYRETGDEQVKEYLNDKLRQAKWVITSVKQRHSTLMNCARCVVNWQDRFFRQGPGHLRPMLLADVARELGIHESTVSRAVKDKYIQCAYGVFPLGYFFSRSLGGGIGEEEVTPDQAKTFLRELIDQEDKKKPLSDQKLAKLLKERGVSISRRTVAKYRDELGISSTARRKEL